jgi:glyoxylase-like metal-dependent hydrolase (beta-lactamase superfamily II)
MVPQVSRAAADVFQVQGPSTNWQLLLDGRDVTLVDGGWPRDFGLVTASLAQVGRSPADVVAIVLTHAHRDHMGTAAEFQRRHDVPVLSHHREAPHVRGEVVEEISVTQLLVRLWRPQVMAFVANIVRHGATHIVRVREVETFDDGEMLDVPGHPTVITTPGHTSGHCAFLLASDGVLLSGDALVTYDLLHARPMLGAMPAVFDHDPAQSQRSLERLATVAARLILPGHGAAVDATPAEAVERALGHVPRVPVPS